MNKQSPIHNPRSKIVIAGAGPAGSTLAIRLAQAGLETVLIEREHFPRHKLCGEFISPECLKHFDELGVMESMMSAGGDRIAETRFFESGGRSIAVPSEWFGSGSFALGLSRSEMDHRLLERARNSGVEVHEGTSVTGLDRGDDGRITGITTRASNGEQIVIDGDIFADATGRARVLARLDEKQSERRTPQSVKPAFVGFKSHVRDAEMQTSVCEIYSFAGGYAGLSTVENGLANLCFLIKAETVREFGGDAGTIVDRVVRRNVRAAITLQNVSAATDWLAVAIDGFGAKSPAPADNLFALGDAASFIDPFTGSGMVMAMESSRILADSIVAENGSSGGLRSRYLTEYHNAFSRRLRVCSLLRRTAFAPRVATVAVGLLGVSSTVLQSLARWTRR